MKFKCETILTVLGFCLIFAVLSQVIIERLVFADGCNMDCTSDNEVCHGDNYGVVCTCKERVNGITWFNTPTYGSTTGDQTLTFESVGCYTAYVCYTLNGQNSRCIKDFGIYKCQDAINSECAVFVQVMPEIHPYRNCKSWFCLEE